MSRVFLKKLSAYSPLFMLDSGGRAGRPAEGLAISIPANRYRNRQPHVHNEEDQGQDLLVLNFSSATLKRLKTS